MSDALNFRVDAKLNPYYDDGSRQVDSDLVQAEHDSIKRALTDAGVEVVTVPSPPDSQDGVYTANWALVRGDKAVLANLPEPRKTEREYARHVLTNLGKQIYEIPQEYRFSGQGDALACGPYLFCGSGYRSDEQAQTLAADILGYEKIQLRTVPHVNANGNPVINGASGWPDSYFYDLDLALSVIKQPTRTKKGLIAYTPQAFTDESRWYLRSLTDIDTVEISLQEAKDAYAANLISTGETVVMSAEAPNLRRRLGSLGLRTVTPKISELSRGGGYIRCSGLTLD